MENRFDQCAESLKRSEGELNDKMKKIFFCVAGLALLAALGVSGWMIHPSGKESVSTETGPRPLTLEEKTDKVVSQMTASQKIGQLMMIGIGGPELDADARYMLTEFPNGNVILFDRNMKKPEQVKKVIKKYDYTVIIDDKDIAGLNDTIKFLVSIGRLKEEYDISKFVNREYLKNANVEQFLK